MQGMVYILQTPAGMKIGKTRNLRKRMKELSRSYEVRFIHAISTHDNNAMERALHQRFVDKRVQTSISTEIFALSQQDVEWIKSIRNFDGRPCFHFDSLTDLVRHSLAVYRKFHLDFG